MSGLGFVQNCANADLNPTPMVLLNYRVLKEYCRQLFLGSQVLRYSLVLCLAISHLHDPLYQSLVTIWIMDRGSQVDGLNTRDSDEKETHIRNILFCLRGVLVDWDPRAALVGQYPDDIIDMVLDPRDEWGIWRYRTLMNLGWDQERVLTDYESTHGPAVAWVFRLYLERFALTLRGMQPGMSALLRELYGQGFKLWGLANTTPAHARLAGQLLTPLSLLTDTLISAQEHVRMPEHLFYQLALRRFRISPEETVFVGDSSDKVGAAKDCGLRGILFTRADDLREEFRKLG